MFCKPCLKRDTQNISLVASFKANYMARQKNEFAYSLTTLVKKL